MWECPIPFSPIIHTKMTSFWGYNIFRYVQLHSSLVSLKEQASGKLVIFEYVFFFFIGKS